MAKWRLAKSIETFRRQLNEQFPSRDKVSDGTIGDTAHSQRKSSHNPDARGAVRAMDITHNPQKGIDGNKLLAALLAAKDSRIWYIIFNRKIYNVQYGFRERPYTGANAHAHHLHLSVSDDPKLYDDASEWKFDFGANPKPSKPLLQLGSSGEEVRKLQDKLGVVADFGENTKQAVIAFQKKTPGLVADGIVGEKTREKLGL